MRLIRRDPGPVGGERHTQGGRSREADPARTRIGSRLAVPDGQVRDPQRMVGRVREMTEGRIPPHSPHPPDHLGPQLPDWASGEDIRIDDRGPGASDQHRGPTRPGQRRLRWPIVAQGRRPQPKIHFRIGAGQRPLHPHPVQLRADISGQRRDGDRLNTEARVRQQIEPALRSQPRDCTGRGQRPPVVQLGVLLR